MFVLKKKFDELDRIVEDHETKFYGAPFGGRPGLLDRIRALEAENLKLKAVVAELVDYVYADKPKQGGR